MIVVLTGTTSGIGKCALQKLRAMGVDVRPTTCDLANLSDIRTQASYTPFTDVLLNNAGVMGLKDLTADGFERAFGVNYLAHFLLTMLLLKNSPSMRVINVSSRAHLKPKSFTTSFVRCVARSDEGIAEYIESKLALVMFTKELHRRGVKALAVHPGSAPTDIWRWVTPKEPPRYDQTPEGAADILLRLMKEGDFSGAYYDKLEKAPCNPLAEDREITSKLWDDSMTFVGLR